MPFGIPPRPADMIGNMADGIERNLGDLSAIGSRLITKINNGIATNKSEFNRFMAPINNEVNKVAIANSVDLGNVAQSLTLLLAGGAQANAGDLGRFNTAASIAGNAQGVKVAGARNVPQLPEQPVQPKLRNPEILAPEPNIGGGLLIPPLPEQGIGAPVLAIPGITAPVPPQTGTPIFGTLPPHFGEGNSPIFVPPELSSPKTPLSGGFAGGPASNIGEIPFGGFAGGLTTAPTIGECSFLPQCVYTGIGFPGTIEFCQCLQQIPQELQSLNDAIMGWIDGKLNAEYLITTIFPQLAATEQIGIQPAITGAFQAILSSLLEQGRPLIDNILKGLRCLIKTVAQMNSAGDTKILILLLILKWLLGAIKLIELGVDPALWFVDKIELQYGPLETLLDRLIQWAFPVEIPSPVEATNAWMQGFIPVEIRNCVYQLHGFNPTMYERFALAESERLAPEEIMQLGKRRDWSDEKTQQIMQLHGWQRQEDLDGKMELFWQLPTIGDHLHWLARNVDDSDYVQRFGLLDGFSTDEFIHTIPEYGTYHTVTEQHGRNFWARFGHDLISQGMKPEYAALHYAAHWIQPSPEQMREFVYRLRPDKEGVLTPFTPADFDRILAEQDYAPLARQWFGATLPRVPALTYIIGMYRQGVINEQELQGYHQDLGYTFIDSERFVEVDKAQKAQFRASRFHGWTPPAIATAYALGQVPDFFVDQNLAAQGATPNEISDFKAAAKINFEKLPIQRARSRAITRTVTQVGAALVAGMITEDEASNMLKNLGFDAKYVQTIVRAEVAAGRIKVINHAITSVRTSYHGGFITIEGARNMLNTLGITVDRQNEYLSTWVIENGPARKHRTAKEIVNDVSYGMMDQTEAMLRLSNLGYSYPDQLLYLADAQRSIVTRQAKSLAAAQRDSRIASQEQARLAIQASRQASQLRAEASRNAPRSVLQKWLQRGIISPNLFRARMTALGIDIGDTNRYVREAVQLAPRSTVVGWYKKGVIDEPELRQRLTGDDWTTTDIDRFVQESQDARQKAQAKTQATQNQ